LLMLFRVVGWTLGDVVSRTMQPYTILFSVQNRGDRVAFLARLSTKITFALATLFSALIWVFGELGLKLWLGPGMFLGYGPLGLLAGSFLIDVLFLSTNNFMVALDHHRRLALAVFGYALLSGLLGWVGAKFDSHDPLLGLCAGFFVASILGQGLVLPGIARRWLKLGWRHYLIGFIARPALLAVCAGALAFGFRYASGGLLWRCSVTALALLAGLPAVCWFLVLDADERKWIPEKVAELVPRLSLAQDSV